MDLGRGTGVLEGVGLGTETADADKEKSLAEE
jgi:hypothetical protein